MALVLVAVALICVFAYMACSMDAGKNRASQGSLTPQELSGADNEVDMTQGVRSTGTDTQLGAQSESTGQPTDALDTAASESSQGAAPDVEPSQGQQGNNATDAPIGDDGGSQGSASGTTGETWTDYY